MLFVQQMELVVLVDSNEQLPYNAYIIDAIHNVVCYEDVTSKLLVVSMYVTACPIIWFKPNSRASSHCKHERVLFHG